MLIKADLAQSAERERLVEEAVAAYGPIDILVNNAAITFFTPVADFTEKRFKLMMEVQVYAPFHLAQLVLPSMRQRRQGWIRQHLLGARESTPSPLSPRGQGRHGLRHVPRPRWSVSPRASPRSL